MQVEEMFVLYWATANYIFYIPFLFYLSLALSVSFMYLWSQQVEG